MQFMAQFNTEKPFTFCNYWANNDGVVDLVEKVWHEYIHGCMSFKNKQKLKNLKLELKNRPVLAFSYSDCCC